MLINLDLEFLIKEIDKFNKKQYENLLIDEIKLKLNQRISKVHNIQLP